MESIRSIEWGSVFLEPRTDRAVERRFRRATGRNDKALRHFIGVPWVEDCDIALATELMRHVALEPNLADLIALVVSRDNACRFCFAATRAFLRLIGMSERRISRLEYDVVSTEFEPPERAALDFSRRMSRSDPLVTPADLVPLWETGFSELAVREIAANVGLLLYFNRVSTLAAIQPQELEALPDRLPVRVLRPLIAPIVRRWRRRTEPVELDDAKKSGPFAYAVQGLNGLPVAGALHDILVGMWASDLLPKRTKGLLFAVVSRTLGCPIGERESRRLLDEVGCEGAWVTMAIDHLNAPELSDLERRLLPFARESVWYQPAAIQRRVREVTADLSREERIELVATLGLANTVCRLGFLAELEAR